MAQLPPDGTWVMQQIGGQVILFERYTEAEIVRFDPSDADATAKAQRVIHMDPRLNDEQRCFAHFWSGYFYAHSSGDTEPIALPPSEAAPDASYEEQMEALSRYSHNYRRVLKFVEERQISDDEYAVEVEERRPEVPIEEAHVVGSRIVDGPRKGLHTLIIDVDHPVRAPRSSSYDHHHLYIDYPMPWENVVKVLRVLAEVGIVEPGYALASIDRGETNVRLPWVRKGADETEIAYTTDKEGRRHRWSANDGEAPF